MGAFRILQAGPADTVDAGRGMVGAADRAVSADAAAGSRLRGLADGSASLPALAAVSVGPPPPPPVATATRADMTAVPLRSDVTPRPDVTMRPDVTLNPSVTMPPPRPDGRRASLADLTGVRPSDGDAERGRVRRDRPRLAFTPTHALGAILLLAAALSASLTMLLNQAIRYETALSAANAATRSAAHDDGAGDTGITDGGGGAGTTGGTGDADRSADTAGDTTGGTTVPAPDGESGGGKSGGGASDGVAEDDAPASADTIPSDDGRIDLNTATTDDLQTINGIGPVTAGRIIDYRTQHGRFDSVDQLLDIKGIGAKTLAKIRDQVTVR